jgi:DNA polymerase elongation subunit (family B)
MFTKKKVPKVLLLDIETAPHKVFVWGLYSQDINPNDIEEPGYTLCFSAKWLGTKKITFHSVYHDGVNKMIKTIHQLMDEADIIIHYNGKKFDIPILNKEFLNHGLAPPAPYEQIDLLKIVQRKFRLASNKLDYVSQNLGLGSKVEHKGMSLWKGCMNGNKEDWRKMEQYNKRDVILLDKLYRRLLPWIDGPNFALYNERSDIQCVNCGSSHLQSRGVKLTRTMVYRRFQCQSCGKWMRARTNCLTKEKKKSILVGI